MVCFVDSSLTCMEFTLKSCLYIHFMFLKIIQYAFYRIILLNWHKDHWKDVTLIPIMFLLLPPAVRKITQEEKQDCQMEPMLEWTDTPRCFQHTITQDALIICLLQTILGISSFLLNKAS